MRPPPPRSATWAAVLGWLALACVLALHAASARADIPSELAGAPIREVVVAGEAAAVASPREVGIAVGTPLTRAVVRAAVERLVATGRFTDVQVEAEPLPEGVRLRVLLVPRIVLHRIQISGTRAVPESAVRDALRVSEGSEVALERLPALTLALTRLYAERGYLAAHVEIALRDTDDPSSKVLLVQVDEGEPVRIASLAFQGEAPLDPGAALATMSTQVGDVLDRTQLENEVSALETWLRTQGYLETSLAEPLVTIEGSRARVSIPARLGPRYRVLVHGATPYKPSEIYEALALTDEALTATHLRHTLGERVADFYARRGFVDTQVQVSRHAGARPGEAQLVVAIEPGEQLRVVKIAFPGARHFERDLLSEQVVSYLDEELPSTILGEPVDSEVVDQILIGEPAYRKRDVAPPPLADPEQMYYAPAYERALRHIAELYQGEGYLAVRVGPAQLQRVGEDRAAVVVPIVEGPRTFLHAVRLVGSAELPARDLLVAAALERGEPFSYLRLEQARRRILDTYHENGYVFAKVGTTVRFSGDRTRAEVEIEIVEGFQVYVDRILVKGADRTSEALIRRVVELEPGDLYTPSAARESERQLAMLGVFTGISVALEDPDLPARVKSVLVTVSERRSQYLDFSAGLSSGQGARGGFEYGYRNLFGQAVGMSLRVQLAYQLFFLSEVVRERYERLSVGDRLERRIVLGTTVPQTPGLRGVRTSIDFVHLRDNERDFGLDKNGVGLTFSKSPFPHTSLTLGSDLENNNVDLFEGEALADYLRRESNPRLQRLLRVPDGSSTLVALRASASYDARDSAFTPTRGFFASAAAELARTLAAEPDALRDIAEFKSRFVKLSLTTSGYLPLGKGFVLAGQARFGRIFDLTSDSETYPNRAFFLGGVDTMRGYLQDEMIPQDVADRADFSDPSLDPNTIVRRADAFVLFRGELRFPLYGQLQGGVFTDLGNLWADPENLDPLDLRRAAGFGLRLSTPVGPIALDWGFNLHPRAELKERTNAIHFSIGLF